MTVAVRTGVHHERVGAMRACLRAVPSVSSGIGSVLDLYRRLRIFSPIGERRPSEPRAPDLGKAGPCHAHAQGLGRHGRSHPCSGHSIRRGPAAGDRVRAGITGRGPRHRFHPAPHRWHQPRDGGGSRLRQLLRAHAVQVCGGGRGGTSRRTIRRPGCRGLTQLSAQLSIRPSRRSCCGLAGGCATASTATIF